jgi:hypothetical protein
MNSDRESRGGRVPLPGLSESGPAAESGPAWRAGSAAPARTDGIRHVRRMSNWTAAALIAGTGGATVALAHQAFPHSTTAAATASTTGTGTTAAHAAGGPSVGHSVATTSASGVTTTTTTRTVNGKTVVSHVRHTPAYHDN